MKVHQRSDLELSNTFINLPVTSLWLTAQTQLSYADTGNSIHPGHTGFTLLHKLTVPEYQVRCSARSLAVDMFAYRPFNVQQKLVSLDMYNSLLTFTAGLKCSRYIRAVSQTQFIYICKAIVTWG